MKHPTTRQVIRCRGCALNQFETMNGMCRRCRLPYRAIETPPKRRRGRLRKDISAPGPNAPLTARVAVTNVCVALRLAQGISQEELSRRMGCPRTYVSKVENHKSYPTIYSLMRFAHHLDIPLWVIIQLATLEAS